MKTQAEIESKNHAQFLAGFGETIGADTAEAAAQWAGFTHCLGDGQRHGIEQGGYSAGVEQGEEFNKMFADA